jgi:hypothetical protein
MKGQNLFFGRYFWSSENRIGRLFHSEGKESCMAKRFSTEGQDRRQKSLLALAGVDGKSFFLV